MYAKAFQVLDLVNKERAKQGLSPLTMDSSLLDTAMQRGFENVLYWSHTRPNGQDCFSANSLMMGENIAMGPDAAGQVMNLWMNSQKQYFVSKIQKYRNWMCMLPGNLLLGTVLW